MLQAHPDINVFSTSGDQMMLGAQQAVKDAGLTGKVLLIGNGTSKQGYAEIKAGTWFADYADIPYTEGQLSGQIAINAVRGIPVLTSVNNDDQRPPFPPDGPIITKENCRPIHTSMVVFLGSNSMVEESTQSSTPNRIAWHQQALRWSSSAC